MHPSIIKSESEHEVALAEIDRLWNAKPGTEDASTRELLALLVEKYERETCPIPPPDPIEAIKFRMEQQGLTRKDLLPVFGTSGRVSEVLSRKRPLTLEMIRRLHSTFDIPLESLISEPPKPKRTSTQKRRPKTVAKKTRRPTNRAARAHG
ncbi:MAG: type II toxin-antitoxin system HigA family antitoxin [Polyangiales bacterium]